MTGDKDNDKLYQDKLIALSRDQERFYSIEDPDFRAKVRNRLCGDDVEVFIKLDHGKIGQASFQGESCAVCKASASLMTSQIEGLTIAESQSLGEVFSQFTTDWNADHIGEEFRVFSVMKNYPSRKRCMTLPWEALSQAIPTGEVLEEKE